MSAPTSDLPGWSHAFAQDFDVDNAVGAFPDGVNYAWNQGGYGQFSTATDTSGNGSYQPSLVLSTHDSYLDIWVHTEDVGGTMTHCVAAPYPFDPAVLNDGAAGRLYGRMAVRASVDVAVGYKISWLLWPFDGDWPAHGEVDFPEGGMGDTVLAAIHHDSGGGVDAFETYDAGVTSGTWHEYVIEWTPDAVKFYVDDTLIGTNTTHVPSTPMYWVLQTETETDGTIPDNATEGHALVDWVSIWDYMFPLQGGVPRASGTELVMTTGTGTHVQNGFLLDDSGDIAVTADDTDASWVGGFLRGPAPAGLDLGPLVVVEDGSGSMQAGFLRDSNGLLIVTQTTSGALMQTGFLRDVDGRLVVVLVSS